MKTKSLILGLVTSIGFTCSTYAQIPITNLIGHYPFTNNADDHSVSTNNGTINNAILTNDRFGYANSAFEFNGTSNITTSSLTINSQTLSFSIWFRITAYDNTNGSRIIEADWSNSGNFSSAVLNSGGNNKLEVALKTTSGQVNLTSLAQIPLNQWQHAAMSYCDGEAKLYLNNILNDHVTNLNPLSNSTQSLIFGGTSIWFFEGQIDDARVYNSCLDSNDISFLYYESPCTNTVTIFDTTMISVTDTLIINANLTGVNPPNNYSNIKVYPNPTNDHITIDYGNYNTLNGYTLKITNSLGQTMFTTSITQQTSNVDLNGWTGNGIYFVHLIDSQSNTIDIKKIVLQ